VSDRFNVVVSSIGAECIEALLGGEHAKLKYFDPQLESTIFSHDELRLQQPVFFVFKMSDHPKA
jgi:hypothetical protein